MLELKNIVKEYVTVDEKVQALKGVSVRFRKSEFVSVLGPSGCGKTTLLNIVGGLDRYTSGDLVINGKSTENFSDKEWDTYRNHMVGFVFQSYNLIPHQTVLENVELALTLSGISKKERRERAVAVLGKVGLGNKVNSRPNQLSGGQMQRVAIARALINDPEILLADEPTGALDSKTSIQIMDLLKEISKDRLIVMVTHNPELAEKYSSRIIRLLDGEIEGDDRPVTDEEAEEERKIASNDARTDKGREKTSMSFMTALMLSFRNLMTKKGRTFLVSFAGSIGIIGIALILSMSSGFQGYINKVQEDTLSTYPVTLQSSTTDYTAVLQEMSGNQTDAEEFPDTDVIGTNNSFSNLLDAMANLRIENDLADFKKYLDSVDYDKKKISAVRYTYDLDFDAYGHSDVTGEDGVLLESVMDSYIKLMGGGSSAMSMMSMGAGSASVWDEAIDNETLLKSQYEIIGKGRWADFDDPDEIMLVVSKYNRVSDYVLSALGLMDPNELLYPMMRTMLLTSGMSEDRVEAQLSALGIYEVPEDKKANRNFSVNDVVGKEFSIVLPSAYYVADENGVYSLKDASDEVVRSRISSARKVKIVGVLRIKEGATGGAFGGNLIYNKALTEALVSDAANSDVVKAQMSDETVDVLTGEEFFGKDKVTGYADNLEKFGYIDLAKPKSISIYATTFENKDYIVKLIDDYNEGKSEGDKIKYTDYVSILMSSVTDIVNAVSYILIGFVSVSLVVSSIMIGIITYISVLERIKEIGILRALGASKRDVSRVFNAETLIIGFSAGLLGILVTILLDIPISLAIYALSGVQNVAALPFGGAVVLVLISMLLTLIAGLIPSRIASKKDPVIALRSE